MQLVLVASGAVFDDVRIGARLVTRPFVHSGLCMGLVLSKGLETNKVQQVVEMP